MNQVTLGHMIDSLSKVDPDYDLPFVFDDPHCNRGWYEKLGLRVCGLHTYSGDRPTVGYLLKFLKEECLGNTFHGWKGGMYVMGPESEVCISSPGEIGMPITVEFWDSLVQMIVENGEQWS